MLGIIEDISTAGTLKWELEGLAGVIGERGVTGGEIKRSSGGVTLSWGVREMEGTRSRVRIRNRVSIEIDQGSMMM